MALLLAGGCGSPRPTHPPTPIPPVVGSKPVLGLETFDAAWKIIQDTHFDTNFNGVDWAAVRASLRPKAEAAGSLAELRRVIEEMLGRLGQSHMALIPRDVAVTLDQKKSSEPSQHKLTAAAEQNGLVGPRSGERAEGADDTTATGRSSSHASPENSAGNVGFDVRLLGGNLVVNRVEPNGPAQDAGVKPGWIVRTIGERSVSELLQKLPRDLDARQTQFMAWRIAKAQLLGSPGSTLKLEFLNEADRSIALNLKRSHETGDLVKFGFLPELYARLQSERLKTEAGGNVGLIRFNLWMIPIAGPFDKAIDEFRQEDGIIIDLRGNLGGLGGMVMGLSGHFLKERVSLGSMKTRGSEMKFFANPRLVSPSGHRVEPYSGPAAILVDSISLSAAEIFAGGMQDIGRARVFGEPTPGQALPAVWDKLPNGDVLYHAIADFVTPSGIRLEARGVIPDEVVPLSREDLLANRDPALAAAMQWIARERNNNSRKTAESPRTLP